MKDKPFQAPPTLLIWARDGVCKNPDDPRPPPQDDDPKSMKWLLENRTDFGTNGWERLLGEENCKMVSIDGNHFSMMKPPVVSYPAPLLVNGQNTNIYHRLMVLATSSATAWFELEFL
jgi:hypothetical protein